MLQLPFPEKIEVRKFFSRHAELNASLPLLVFNRLEQYVSHSEESAGAEIKVELVFNEDDGGRLIIQGSLEGKLPLACQRCLRTIEYKLLSEFRVQVLDELIESGDRELSKEELDVVLAREGKLDLLSLLEDELILSLPLVVYHDEQNCNEVLNEVNRKAQQEGKLKPFAALEALKVQLQQEKDK